MRVDVDRVVMVGLFFFLLIRLPPKSTLFPYTTLFRSWSACWTSAASSAMSTASSSATTGRCATSPRSEEHTSELQSRRDLVCRLLLEKKKTIFPWNATERAAELRHCRPLQKHLRNHAS